MHDWHAKHITDRSFGERVADSVAAGMGSWRFIIIQTIIVVIWMAGNAFLLFHFDPVPFILLNLVFSTQAAYAAPVIMMSQNRSAQRDRLAAESDYQINIDTKKEIDLLMKINQQQLGMIGEIHALNLVLSKKEQLF